MSLSSLKHTILFNPTPWILTNITYVSIFKLKMTSYYLRISQLLWNFIVPHQATAYSINE